MMDENEFRPEKVPIFQGIHAVKERGFKDQQSILGRIVAPSNAVWSRKARRA